MKKLTQNTIKCLLAAALFAAIQSDALAKKPVRTPPPEEPAPEEPTPSTPSLTGKIRAEVTTSGLYKVTAAQIAATLGTSESEAAAAISDGNVRVSSMGSDVSWLKANNSVYFYGEEIGGMYGGNNVYWLELGVNGPQMATAKARAPRKTAPGGVFTDTVLFEEDHVARPNICFDENDEFWFWKSLSNPYGETEATLPCTLDSVSSANTTAQIQVALKGAKDTAAVIDYHVRVTINGTYVGEKQWSALDDAVLIATFSQSILQSGANDVRIESLLPAGAPYSKVLIDSATISYLRNYEAVSGQLRLSGDANNVISVKGFASSDIEVLDLSDPCNPRLNGGTKIDATEDDYMVSFQPASASTPYLSASLAAAKSPKALLAHVDSGLANAANTASYIVITPEVLANAATELASYRQAQGMTTKIVTLKAIYDEFNFGVRDPLAIQAFLAHAVSQWNEAPRYVVLAGQGSTDFNNVTGNNDCLVPPMMAPTPSGLIASDTRYADVDNDGTPELAIGRLPVLTAGELSTVIEKIRSYELGGTWRDSVQMIADNDDSAGYYTSDSELISTLIPSDRTVGKSYLAQQALSDVKNATMASFNAGSGILNYIGHGLIDRLAGEKILATSDVLNTTNAGTSPIVLAMCCDAGRTEVPGYDGLAEQLMRKTDGGATAFWGAAGLAYSAESRILNAGFYESMSNGSDRLGDAINGALTKYAGEGHMAFMRYVYNLQGDPAMVISNNTL
ncbi:MAG: hypothetical protein ISS35_02520 [Kiritimatiellae bacterium]|nr:hypothetical protein [Kiritimatiellia bacterium]